MHRFFKEYTKAAVALSGGADSACVILLAAEYLGTENITAYTCINEHIFSYEIQTAKQICQKLNIRHVLFKAFMPEEFYTSPETRCYHCKHSILSEIKRLAGNTVIFDGTTAEDSPDDRPGFKALKETGTLSPLRLAGVGKAYVNEIIKKLNIIFYDESCKASRLKLVTSDKLTVVEKTEDSLREKYSGIRYRLDDNRIVFKKPTKLQEADFSLIISATARNL